MTHDTDPKSLVLGEQPLDGDDKLAKYKQDITNDADIMDDQRQKAQEDMRFINVSGGMWENFLETNFPQNRVRLELDTVSDFVQRFAGQWSQNRVGVEYKPDDDKTSDDDAELLNGIYRADFRDNNGKNATDNTVLETSTCGYGALKLATEFEDGENPINNNMRVVWRELNNAYDSVFWDRSAQSKIKKDARHCTYLEAFSRDGFEAAFPGFSPSSAYTPTSGFLMNFNSRTFERFFVATRYEVVKIKTKVFVYNNLATEEVEAYNEDDHELVKDELKKDEFRQFVRERKSVRQTVQKTVFSGGDILEPTRRIAGKWIPIIPFYGYRTYVDGAEWYRGLVRKLKDAARVFNMQASQVCENASSHGQNIPIFASEQMKNAKVRANWADRNNKSYLTVDALRDKDGNIIANGPLGYLQPGQLDGNSAALFEIILNYIQSQTGGAPQDTMDPDASGKAIRALQKREDLKTQTINENIKAAIAWQGEVFQAIAAEIYNEPRIVKTIGKDGTESRKQLFKVIQDEQTGLLVESNKINGKKFKAYPDVGTEYETLREQTVEDIKGMLDVLKDIPSGEQYIPVMLSVMMENIVGVGLDPVKELNRRIMLLQGAVKPETPEEEALLQQAQQAQNQPDPQQQLLEAAATQQQAEARSLDASSVQKVADARKKAAETIETRAKTAKLMADIGISRDKLLIDRNQQVMDQNNTVIEQAREGL